MILGEKVFWRAPRNAIRHTEAVSAILRAAPICMPGILAAQVGLWRTQDDEEEEYEIDLVLIDLTGNRWWIGLVIPNPRDDDEDVIDPAILAQRTRLLESEIQDIASRFGPTNTDVVKDILRQESPGIVCFLSNPPPEIRIRLRNARVSAAIVEAFEGDDGETAWRMNGDLPEPRGQFIARCHRLPLDTVTLRSPDHLDDDVASGKIDIEFAGESHRWRFMNDESGFVIRPLQEIELVGTSYELYKIDAGRFILRGASTKGLEV